MPKFYTHEVDGQAAGNWQAIQAAAAKHKRAIVEVREYDPDAETSDQQRKYWYAKPVEAYMDYTGYDKRTAERELKLKYGDQWFVVVHKGARAVLSIRDISIPDMNAFIESVCAGLEEDCDMPLHEMLPDKDWREHKENE